MTFIASVVAKNGVAVIADSLVTSMELVMNWGEFTRYVESKKNDDGTINIDHEELSKLFNQKPSHTKNFEEKLFVYDSSTVVTTAGSASINGKKIEELIEDLISKNVALGAGYEAKDIATKTREFALFFSEVVKAHLTSKGRFTGTTFIYTNYNKDTHKTSIYKIRLIQAIKKNLDDDPDFQLFEIELMPDHFKVVCDGQNRIAEKILLGDWDTATSLIPKVIDQVARDYKLTIEKADEYYINVFESLQKRGDFKLLADDMKMFQISFLSLQQAVDLACLLMRLEMDVQQYTKNVPTVGGLIKLATISKDGIKLITGDNIIKPEYIR